MVEVERALEFLLNSSETDYRVAANTGITAATIGNYRNGKTKPTKANAMILVKYFTSLTKSECDINGNTNSPDGFAMQLVEKIEDLRQQLGEQINENKHLHEKNMSLNTEIDKLKSEIEQLKNARSRVVEYSIPETSLISG